MNRISSPTSPAPFRILVIDDTPAIHDDFKKILTPDPRLTGAVEPAEHDLFGSPPPQPAVKHKLNFALSCATQGEAGVQLAAEARQANRPFAVAFVDMRMPPGWDGIETAKKLWETDPAIQVVICTAFADHSAGDIVRQLGNSDSLLILKKPFDTVEAWQMAASLAEKWQLSRTLKSHLDSLQTSIEERTEELEKSLALVQATLEGRQRAETALRDSANYYRLLFEKSPTPIYVHDQETFAFLAVNEAAVAHYGYSLHEFLDLTLKEIALVEEIPAFNQKISSLTHDSCNAGIWRHRKKNGKLCSMEITTHALEFAGRKAWLTLAMDVTERLNLEAQLRQSQKMESVGQLAGGIAHDFNNLLTVINGHAGLLLAREQLTPRIAEPLKEIFEAAKRAADLTRQLMAFSRKQILQTQVVDLNEVVNNVSKMLRRVLGEDIALEVSFAGHVSIKADLGMMEQVLLNLAVNSRDAMPRGGRLNINIHPALIDAAQVKANPEANAGLHVCLSFTDTGCGIAPEILPRIFEPFFTTKELDRGTGLGLATVYGIIKQHQGWIEVISELGKGTTFKIFLPASLQKGGYAEMPALEQRVIGGTETILVVEDEAPLLKLIQHILTSYGYEVLESSSSQSALELWAARHDKIDLLLTDMILPDGMTGPELAQKLKSSKPALKVIYTSGYNREKLEKTADLTEGLNFLQKPFHARKLAETIYDCLNKPQ